MSVVLNRVAAERSAVLHVPFCARALIRGTVLFGTGIVLNGPGCDM
jgi:hypothetical protein